MRIGIYKPTKNKVSFRKIFISILAINKPANLVTLSLQHLKERPLPIHLYVLTPTSLILSKNFNKICQ